MPLYHLSRAETGHPLEEGEQNGTKPKVIFGTLPTLFKLSLHAHQHCRTPIKKNSSKH